MVSKQKGRFSEKIWHLLNIIGVLLTILILVIIIIELSVSYLHNFCRGWISVCYFDEVHNICGYFANITYNNMTGKFSIIQTKHACIGLWSVSGYCIFISIIILVTEISTIVKVRSLSLNYMIGQTMASFLNFLCFLYIAVTSQVGFNFFCNQLSIPICERPSQYVGGLNNCRLGNSMLPQCPNVANTLSFIGRYRVISGLAWWGYVLTILILVITLVQLSITKRKVRIILLFTYHKT